jgi:hypothetical protein
VAVDQVRRLPEDLCGMLRRQRAHRRLMIAPDGRNVNP